jgi:TatD DNase family protein
MQLSYVLTDTHAHLEDERFAADAAAVLGRARAAGVPYVVVPATNAAGAARALALARAEPGVFFAAGLHPNDGLSLDAATERALRAALTAGKAEGRAVAVGECGLDYHYMALPRAEQLELLRWHFRLARELDLPLILHQREAEEDLRRLVEEEEWPRRGAVLHRFGGDDDYYAWANDRGFYVSFTGALTFPPKKGEAPPAFFRHLALERAMVETDAPYMTPVPHRGRRNEPAYLPLVAAALAARTGRPEDDVYAETTLAARAFFGLPADFGGAVAYDFKDALYLNVTNRCPNDCVFCLRHARAGVGGYDLRLKMEPTAAEVLAAVGDPRRWPEVVFCGFGEPTARWETVKDVARGLKAGGGRVRLDTNGSASLTAGRDVTPELAGLFDAVAVSVNAADAATYAEVCRPRAGAAAWEALVAFVAGARRYVPEVELTVVTTPGRPEVPAAVEELARRWGVPVRRRPYVA